jgi:ATP-dependent protease ClpP protease subunit
MWGKFEEFKDEMENLEMFMDRIRDIYLKNSKMSKKQVTDFLKREKYFDAKTCLELGLIDEIVTNG